MPSCHACIPSFSLYKMILIRYCSNFPKWYQKNMDGVLTPWCRVLLKKRTGLQLVKFSAFHGTRRFITALTSVRHLSLSWASPIQSIYPHPISWRYILILSTHLRLGFPRCLLPSTPTQYWVRSTNHLAPRNAISAIPPLPRPS